MSKLSVPVSSRDHAQGPADAPVTLVEYGDYQCPSCGDARPAVKKLQRHFGDKVRFVFRNFPLPMHEHAEHAAETAEFADANGKFWEVHDLLYTHQRELGDETLARLVTEAGLDDEALQTALAEETYKERVAEDLESGEASGVQGTPWFYINGEEHDASYDYETLKQAVEAKLAR